MDKVRDLASKNAAVIFTKSSCCMCHSIKTLFYELGASPAIHELDRVANGREMEWALRAVGCNPTVPAVFIGLLISLYYTWITFDEGKTKRMIWKFTLGTIHELENLNATMLACVYTARLIICQAGQYF
ncbi:hypothetical protein OIU77_024694 [Salix suchowensis]|uniref:Glutaredoxin domain-containing protein n=1 Tax=Salix suchowensis TaxID=1278906 RepID=A0ABQ9BTP2_9ROSI|nr:hypothetical protein OIU77_024694 [Salix suchowensis]